MANIASTKDTIKKNIIRDLEEMGFYRPEYDTVISVYAGLLSDYIKTNRKITEKDMRERNPIILTAENLRKDIIKFASELGLTTQGYKKITGDKMQAQKQSKLEKVLSELE